MTQGELNAGTDAVREILEQAGYSSYVSLDQKRGLAAAVIKKVDEYRAEHTRSQSQKSTPPSSPAHVDIDGHENHAVELFKSLPK